MKNRSRRRWRSWARVASGRAVVAALLLALGGAYPAQAIQPAQRHYTVRDGLPQTQVYALIQDRDGFLWAGTASAGVARYDGRHWKAIGTESGLPTPSVEMLTTSPSGTLYAATTGGAAYLDGYRFQPMVIEGPSAGTAVSAILAVSDAEVWLGTRTGLLLWQGDTGTTVEVETDRELDGCWVTALDRDADGRIWVGTDRGLAELTPGSPPRLEVVRGFPGGEVYEVQSLTGNRLAVLVAETGLLIGSPGSFREVEDEALLGASIWDLFVFDNNPGCLWVATEDRGALRWCGERWQSFGVSGEKTYAPVYSILVDREEVLWLGTDTGLLKQSSSAFWSFDDADGLPTLEASFGMTETADGALWFAFWGAGVYRMPRQGPVQRIGPEQNLKDLRVWTVEADGNAVWVFSDAGLGRIENGRYEDVPLAIDQPDGYGGGMQTTDGRLLILTYEEGLYVLEDGAVHRIGEPVGDMVNDLSPGGDGTVWCAGEGWGAVRLRDCQPDLHLTTADGLPSNQVNHVLEDASGTLWLATDRGVWRRRPGARGEVVEELGATFFYWIAEHPEGTLWFGTNNGALRLLSDGTLERYTSKDGLRTDECNSGGVMVDSSGRLFVSTEGLSLWMGHRTPPAVRPQVHVDQVRTAQHTLADTDHVVVRAGSGPVTFSFVCPSFAEESATRFRFRLVGLSDEWTTSARGEQSATYGGLTAGRYRFEVTARTSDGRSSTAPAVTTLIVTPQWWQRPMVRLGAILALAILALAAIHWRDRRFETEQHRLETLVTERTGELVAAKERFAELAVTDELTGLVNRRSILDSLGQLAAIARRSSDPLAAAVIDVDHFKAVNDSLGHEVGDLVLRAVSGALLSALREQDLVGRYGGDEFLALFPGTDADDALVPCDRMREAVAASVCDLQAPACEVTVSIGVAEYSNGDADPDTLIRRADEALYLAKAAGRDTATIAR